MTISELSTTLNTPYSVPAESEVRSDTTKVAALTIASYLTEPVCKVREYFYTLQILNETCKTTAQKVMRATSLVLGMAFFSVLTPLTAPVGILLRGVVAKLESKPYIYLERPGVAKRLPENRQITLVSHNVCYMPAGYCITDGGVAPASDRERINANLRKIKELDPDIVCLYEVPDICDAAYLSSQLPEYPFLIPVAGVRAIGPSSMMYVASKYKLASIEFTPFIKGTELTGRAQFSEKGVLSFDITDPHSTVPLATIFSTHLQHSEIPAQPEKEEQRARAAQMHKIAQQIQAKIAQNGAVIFTGDLNQEESELQAFLARHQIDWLRRDPSVQGTATWGGDGWCAKLMGKPASGPLTLDYTFVAGRATAIATRIFGTGYSGLAFRREATSDHDLLFSTITLPP